MKNKLFLILLLNSLSLCLYAQDQSEYYNPFADDDVLEVDIKADLKKLYKLKNNDEALPATMIIKLPNGKVEQKDFRLIPRGAFRKQYCHFPPVKFNFKNTEFNNPALNEVKNVKLVAVCKMQDSYQQYIIKEYLIYKMYNLFTEKSFKVKMLRINYVDTHEKVKTLTRYGFIIEPKKMMAERNEGVLLEKEGLSFRHVEREYLTVLSIFQFMIANTDWQVESQQNLKLLRVNKNFQDKLYSVPYDFDYTGFVNASYAVPSEVLGIDHITTRLFWGPCRTEEEWRDAITIFQDKKQEIFSIVQKYPLLDEAYRKQAITYLESFYSIIDNERLWKRYFIDNCKN